jgi:CMP-N-acetylneuraminic acid synthetase
MIKYADNNVYRRQDLEPLYYHDGSVVAVRREALFTPPAHAEDYHAFFGRDRRAIVQGCYDTVDIDDPEDLVLAGTLLCRSRSAELRSPIG